MLLMKNDGIIIWTAFVVRVVLLGVGTYQDTHFQLKYTDIDYEVYTDAAYFLWHGDSPYKRSTYRYTPLLAALLTPNVYLHPLFGKIIFCCADIAAALLMKRLLSRRGALLQRTRWLSDAGLAIWLFSPFTVSISTRGNGESLVTLILISMLDLVETRNLAIAGILFGLAVHWRLYPVIYTIPLFLNLLTQKSTQEKRSRKQKEDCNISLHDQTETGVRDHRTSFNYSSVLSFFSPAAAIFLCLGAYFYFLYGDEFLQEAYLYHATRTDPRHNFSPYFYPAYLKSQPHLSPLNYVKDGSR